MKSIRKLLAIVDPDEGSDFVLERTQELAKAYQAQVLLFMNKPNGITPERYSSKIFSSWFFRKQETLFTEHYEQRLEELRQQLTERGIETDTTFSTDKHAAEAILECIDRYQPDITLKGIQKQGLLKRILITNVDWRLIKHCRTPLLLVKARRWHENGAILGSVDPMHVKAQQNELDHLILETTTDLARHLDQSPRVYHCYFPDLNTMFPKVIEAGEYLREVRRKHEEKIRELLQAHDLGMDQVSMTRGDIVRTLLNCIHRERVNVLVIGALSRNFVERTIVGSTVEKILYDTPCDVLVIKNRQQSQA